MWYGTDGTDLEHTHVGGEGGLVPHGGGDTAEQGRHLGSCLGETEDVVHEEKHVLPFGIPEVLSCDTSSFARSCRELRGCTIATRGVRWS